MYYILLQYDNNDNNDDVDDGDDDDDDASEVQVYGDFVRGMKAYVCILIYY